MLEYHFSRGISQLSLDIVSKAGPIMLELFPPKRQDNPKSKIYGTEYAFRSSRKLNVELSHSGDEPNEKGITYIEVPCLFQVDLDNRKVLPFQTNRTQGFKEIRPYLEELISELS